MVNIFRTNACTGTETVVFHTGFNIGCTGPILAIPGYIPSFSRKLDTGLGRKKEKKEKEVDLTHSNSEILLTPICDLFILASHWL